MTLVLPIRKFATTALCLSMLATACGSSSDSSTKTSGGDDAGVDSPAEGGTPDGASDAGTEAAPPLDGSSDGAVDGSSGVEPSTVYTIGGSDGDYATFTLALDDLKSGAIGVGADGILFLVRPGEYPERVMVPPIEGADAASPVIFRAESGDVSLTGSGTSEKDAMVTLASADHVTFEGIGIANGGSDDTDSVEIGYLLEGTEDDGCQNNAIVNASIDLSGPPVTSSSRGVLLRSRAVSGSPAEAGCSGNHFRGLEIDGVATGIDIRGPVRDALQRPLLESPDADNVVADCRLGLGTGLGHATNTGGARGIGASNQVDFSAKGNQLGDIGVTGEPLLPVGVAGISLDAVSGRIAANQVHGLSYQGQTGSFVTGLRLSPHPSQALTVANNFVSGLSRSNFDAGTVDPSIYVRGIWTFGCSDCEGMPSEVHLRHNTVIIETPGDAGYPTAAFELTGGPEGALSVSSHANILVNRVGASACVGAYAVVDEHGSDQRQFLESDDNLLFVEGPGAVLGQLGRKLGAVPTDAASLAEWQSLSDGDAVSANVDPSLVSESDGDLHLEPSFKNDPAARCETSHGEGQDIDAESRSASTPLRGADE